MKRGSPSYEDISHAVSGSPPSRQPSSQDKDMRSIQKAPKLGPQAPEEKSSPTPGCTPASQPSSLPTKKVRAIKKKREAEARTPKPKSLPPTASSTKKTGASSPEPKPTEARENVPKIKPPSHRSKKKHFAASPNQTRGSSPPLTERVQSTKRRPEMGIEVGNDERTPVAASSFQTAGPSTPLSKGMQARQESPEVEPQVLEGDEQSTKRRPEMGTMVGSDERTPMAASSFQVAGPSRPMSEGMQARQESPEVEPQVREDDEQPSCAAGPPRSHSASPAAPASPAYTLPARGRVPVAVSVVSTAALALVFVIFALIWLVSANFSFVRSKNTTDASFCCPNEAAQLHAVIDDTVPPCKDFFAYVCRRAIQDGVIEGGFAVDTLDRIAADIIKGTGNFTSAAARALHGYFTSCLSEVWRKDLRHEQVTSAIVGMANATSGRMTPADLLRFALNVQFRYHINFFFGVVFSVDSVEFEWNFMRAITFLYYCRDGCFEAALSGVNAHLKTNYTRQDIVDWQQLLPHQSDAGEPGNITTKELLEAFGGLDVSLFEAIMKEMYPDFSLKHPIYSSAKRALLAEIGVLWNVSAQPMSLCYILTCVVISATKEVQGRAVLDFPTSQIWQVCTSLSSRFTALWRRTYVGALTSPAKDVRMRSIFAETRKALLLYEPLLQLMKAGNDTGKFEAFVRNTSLLLPNDVFLSEVRVPTLPEHGFVDNYFRALSFEFDVKREAWIRGARFHDENIDYELWNRMVLVSEDLYVSPIAYALLSTVNASRALLADAPVVASRMAALLWERVVQHQGWSSRTLAAIEHHRQCMLKSFRVHADVAEILLENSIAVQIAAGLASGATDISTKGSLFGAAPDWFEVKPLWSLYMSSKARFFYARYAYFWCIKDEYVSIYINGPLRRSADFAAAFNCPPFQETADSSACWNYMR
ncbi:uncharacterized protein [Dermacentor albipictus]|uniref:uncharacterized protein n=1 Tax=Dermacentor albipictus TaxID=60249 RepID=UPI0031FC0581